MDLEWHAIEAILGLKWRNFHEKKRSRCLCKITDNSGVSSASQATTSTSGQTFTLAEFWEMSPVHLRMADVQISSSLSPCPPPGRIERNGTVLLNGVGFYTIYQHKFKFITTRYIHISSPSVYGVSWAVMLAVKRPADEERGATRARHEMSHVWHSRLSVNWAPFLIARTKIEALDRCNHMLFY